ncbi:MAG: PfkB family carbohydrate kinase [Solirubrobacterales bacterium]
MIVSLGEALVDLICERRTASLTEADCFTPHFGGALANVAVAARRTGAETALAGAAGDDDWGRWLAEQLEREAVELEYFELLSNEQTPIAFASFDETGEPSFQIYGDAVAVAVQSVGPRLDTVLERATALVYGSTTLATAGEREVTLRARDLALERGLRVCFDPNIRPNRWGGDPGPAARASRELVAGSAVVRANRDEATAIAGVDDPREAAAALVELGAELAVVTLGAEGAVMRGACEAELPAPEVEVVTTLGAGDAFMGTLVGGLAGLGWDLSRADEALPAALDAAADACSRWSAL